MAREQLVPSTVPHHATGSSATSTVRTSNGMFFKRGETDVVARVEQRLARFLDWPVDWGEGIANAALRCGRRVQGASRLPHASSRPQRCGRTPEGVRQRVATVLMYLNEPEDGGGTAFTDVHLEVAPRRCSSPMTGPISPRSHAMRTVRCGPTLQSAFARHGQLAHISFEVHA